MKINSNALNEYLACLSEAKDKFSVQGEASFNMVNSLIITISDSTQYNAKRSLFDVFLYPVYAIALRSISDVNFIITNYEYDQKTIGNVFGLSLLYSELLQNISGDIEVSYFSRSLKKIYLISKTADQNGNIICINPFQSIQELINVKSANSQLSLSNLEAQITKDLNTMIQANEDPSEESWDEEELLTREKLGFGFLISCFGFIFILIASIYQPISSTKDIAYFLISITFCTIGVILSLILLKKVLQKEMYHRKRGI